MIVFPVRRTNTLGGNRIRRSRDEIKVKQQRDEMRESITLSMSQQALGAEKEEVRAAMRMTAPEGMDLGAKNNMLLCLDTTNPNDWELMVNGVVGGKALHLAELIAHTQTDAKARSLIRVPKAR